MSDNAAHAAMRFPLDTAKHRLLIIRDEGVYRHMRAQQPGTMNMSFSITTWPGYLAYTGDMGDYVFSRLEDMFEFFRHDKPNPSYWAEKCVAACSDGITDYSEAVARGWVKEQLEAYDADEQVRSEAADLDYESEHSLRAGLRDIDFNGFSDAWEADFTEYTHRFLWCCHALVWTVRAYDQSRQAPRPLNCSDAFAALVADVATVDPTAAAYMAEPHDDIRENRTAEHLSTWAVWKDTPQGHDYWNKIFDALCVRRAGPAKS